MNLHGIASAAIGTVNPHVLATVQVSTGAPPQPDGTRVPTYAAPVTISAQVQQLTTRDLAYLSGLGIQGSTRKLYLNGRLDGIVRQDGKGGDLVTLGSEVYLVTAVLEAWPDWCAVAVTRQMP